MVRLGSTLDGLVAMERVTQRQNNNDNNNDKDILATMMRQTRCLHKARYSTDAAANLQMLSKEFDKEEKADNK